MYSRRLPLPELEAVWDDPVAAPVGRFLHGLALLLQLGLSLLKRGSLSYGCDIPNHGSDQEENLSIEPAANLLVDVVIYLISY